jgi:hypothetical protein
VELPEKRMEGFMQIQTTEKPEALMDSEFIKLCFFKPVKKRPQFTEAVMKCDRDTTIVLVMIE